MAEIIAEFENKQATIRIQGKITSFFNDFQIGSLLNRAGIRKLKGISPHTLFATIFSLAFEGRNFFQGIVKNDVLGFHKDAAYSFLENPRHNWRLFLLRLSVIAVTFFDRLTSEKREKVLVIDDSVYNRGRSKMVELLTTVYDHANNTYVKGFKLLMLGWTDGHTFVPLDFVLRSSVKVTKRIQSIIKVLDKRTCGYKRRLEAMMKSTDLLEDMVIRALKAGIEADYILMDSWFCFPSVLAALSNHLPVICMAKDMPSIRFTAWNVSMRLSELYRRVKKRPGKATILAEVVCTMSNGLQVKVVFVRHRRNGRWLALVSTRIDLPAEDIIRIYGKRWDIEVFFKMAKHYLNLEREVQLRDYDGLVGHATIVMSRYIFLAFEQRLHDDPRTIGTLFFACSDEIQDVTLIEALTRILTLAMERVRTAGELAEKVILQMVDAIMGAAIEVIKAFKFASQNLMTSQ